MSALTRRRSDNPHHVTWHVYYGDVRVGRSVSAPACRSTSINGDGLAASIPDCILASVATERRPRSTKHALALRWIGGASFLRYPMAPSRSIAATEKRGPRLGPFVLAARNCRPRSLHLSCAVFAASPSIATRQPKAMITAGIFMPHTPRGEGGKSKSLNPMHADRAAFRIFAHDSAISDILA